MELPLRAVPSSSAPLRAGPDPAAGRITAVRTAAQARNSQQKWLVSGGLLAFGSLGRARSWLRRSRARRPKVTRWNPAMAASMPVKKAPTVSWTEKFLGIYGCTKRALYLVWVTSRWLTFSLALLTLLMGALPGLRAATTKRVIDAVVAGMNTGSGHAAVAWLLVEAAIVVTQAAARRGFEVAESFLGTLLGNRVNVMILQKALDLQLTDFEDSTLYDKLTRARREASQRPLSLAKQSLSLLRNSLALLGYGALLLGFSPMAVAVLVITAIPPFIAGVKFAGDAFQLARRQTSGFREQIYLERVMAMDAPAKEVKLFGLGPWLLKRYRGIFDSFFKDTSNLALRQGSYGFLLELISTSGLYAAFAWVALAAVRQQISLGDMTMYLLIFQEGQQAFSSILRAIGGMYADNLYLSNLYEFLDYKVQSTGGTATSGPSPGDGLRFEEVWFRYPGATEDTIKGVTFHIPPGTRFALVGNNGAGKTTLIKLLTGLYQPNKGRILLDGRDLREWDPQTLKSRCGAIFQDFVRYELTVGENVGVGDIDAIEEEPRLQRAAEKGMAAPFIDEWPQKYRTQLGNLFMRGRELSGGQWQKVALSRALMRDNADLLILDEPTAAMDAEAEAQIFERLASLTAEQSALLISHRFSTVRMADQIAVLNDGVISEYGSHQELLALEGTYSRLFNLQTAWVVLTLSPCNKTFSLTLGDVRAMSSFKSLSLLRPSLKPSELLTFEDLSFVKPEELNETRNSWIGKEMLVEVSERSDARMSYTSWTEYGPEDQLASPNRSCHERSKQEVERFMQLSLARPARLRQWIKQKRSEGGNARPQSCFNAMLAFMRGAP